MLTPERLEEVVSTTVTKWSQDGIQRVKKTDSFKSIGKKIIKVTAKNNDNNYFWDLAISAYNRVEMRG